MSDGRPIYKIVDAIATEAERAIGLTTDSKSIEDGTLCRSLSPLPGIVCLSPSGVNLVPERKIAFGKKVSLEFKAKVIMIGRQLQVNPDYLMAAMAFESGGTFSPSIPNAAGSGAVGLIQFMPKTAKDELGTNVQKLRAMTAVRQLDYVYSYFKGYTGRLHSLDDVYMVILWPAAVGKPGSYVLFEQDDKEHPKWYAQNKGLDTDKDGKVTKSEAAAAVRRSLLKGLSAENYG
jgi:hypothetical protein